MNYSRILAIKTRNQFLSLLIGIGCLAFAGTASSASITYNYSGSGGATGMIEFSSVGIADAENFSGATIIAGSFDFSTGTGFEAFDILDYVDIISNSWSAANGEMVSVSYKANNGMLFGLNANLNEFNAFANSASCHVLETLVGCGLGLSHGNVGVSTMNGLWTLGTVSPVPVPAAIWLFGSGLVGLIGFAKRKKAQR